MQACLTLDLSINNKPTYLIFFSFLLNTFCHFMPFLLQTGSAYESTVYQTLQRGFFIIVLSSPVPISSTQTYHSFIREQKQYEQGRFIDFQVNSNLELMTFPVMRAYLTAGQGGWGGRETETGKGYSTATVHEQHGSFISLSASGRPGRQTSQTLGALYP